MRHVFLKRASLFGALFFCASYLFADNHCKPDGQLDFHQVVAVFDGDTVKLKNGRKVRFIGINTPEIGRDGKPDDAFAQAGKQTLKDLLSHANNRIGLLAGKTRKDRYDRQLRHAFLPSGLNIGQQLIQQGLASHIIITPNTNYLDCYAEAQAQARQQQLGIWSRSSIVSANDTKSITSGFHHIKGKITRIGESRRHIWLNFGQNLAIKINRKNLPYFDAWHPRELLNKVIETSGWVYTHRRKGRTERRMQVYHPAAIHILK